MQFIRGFARILFPSNNLKRTRTDDSESSCEDCYCCPHEPNYRAYLQLANEWFIRAYPRGFGKRAKRSCMRKALRNYKLAYRALKNHVFEDNLDKLDAKFKILFFVGTAYRSLCEEDMVMHTLDRLTNLMLYEMKDDMIDEYDLAVMGLHSSSLISMYRTGYPSSKLTEAREMMRSMEETDPEAFDKMPMDFIQSHFHYSGLLHLIQGQLVEAQKDFTTSLEMKAIRCGNGEQEDKFDKLFEAWTQKLLKKTDRKLKAQLEDDAQVVAAQLTMVVEEDLDGIPTNEPVLVTVTGLAEDVDVNDDIVILDKVKNE